MTSRNSEKGIRPLSNPKDEKAEKENKEGKEEERQEESEEEEEGEVACRPCFEDAAIKVAKKSWESEARGNRAA